MWSFFSTYSIRGSHLFTASGAQYFHLFNISLCGKAPAQCFNNVSYQMDGQTSQVSTLKKKLKINLGSLHVFHADKTFQDLKNFGLKKPSGLKSFQKLHIVSKTNCTFYSTQNASNRAYAADLLKRY